MYSLQPEAQSSSTLAPVLHASDTESQEQSLDAGRVKIKASFLLARPVPKHSLRVSSKLLLQVQQLPKDHRPVPVLEIRQPLLFKSKFTRGFQQDVKLRSGDLFAHLIESYVKSSPAGRSLSNSEDQTIHGKTFTANKVVGAICHNEMASKIFFQDARFGWQGRAIEVVGPQKSRKCYRFAINNEERDPACSSGIILQWEKKNEDVESAALLNGEMFTLFLIDRRARRKAKMATITNDRFEMNVRKSFVRESLQDCFDLMGYTDSETGDPRHVFESRLYTLTLTLGIWVGFQEAWFN
ncbi:uncharacterized protein N7483_002368 [Penicillium malachiteum]|uniref:uncharacterized protein n=1 Tax=Penicillium malachiteum TaxID=1324776 RepID=UPI002547089C|nr:uncharacterized protein N7483_002368 [Penicillium malachiteum]KAJ5737243.1 hypothetical protein N7483_002368 [Penicillium malachiteum]